MQSKSLNILVIEDNPGDLLIFNHYFSLTGIGNSSIVTAETMASALNILRKNKPDLIFLDLFLPDSNNLDTFEEVNKIASFIPIVILSGLTDSETAINAIKSGAQDYLIKGDYDEKILAKSIHYSIERKKIQGNLNHSLEMHELVGKATNDVIWEWDLEKNTILSLSRAIETDFGYADSEMNSTLDWWLEKVHPDDLQPLADVLSKSLRSNDDKTSHEFRFRNSKGEFREVLARSVILRKNNGSRRPYRMIGALQDITALKVLQRKVLKQHRLYQQKITEATIQSQEKEREELGKELHDNINQILSTSKMFIDIAIKNKTMREELLPKSFDYLSSAIEELRKLSKSLVPPSLEDLGLEEAIRDLLATASLLSQTDYSFDSDDMSEYDIANSCQLMLYRIVQEQLNNIAKYARATQVRIHLWFENKTVILTIADNGVGFDTNLKVLGIGLRNIKSRVEMHRGKVKIITSPGHGCTLKIYIPLENKHARQAAAHDEG